MAKSKFNLGDFINVDDMSKLDTPEQITRIPLDLIDPDPANFYSLEGIEDLAANIETVGLLDAPRVRPGENGRYVVVSGHRRRAACMLIRDGGNPMFDNGLPCIIELGEAGETMRELRMIFANSATRIMSQADLSKQAERVTELLYELKKQGFEFSGRMRAHVAAACQVSESKIARWHAIRENLIPVLLGKFDAGHLNEAAAYRLSQEAPETQENVWRSCGISISGVSADSVSAIIDQVKKEQTKTEDRVVEGAGPYRDTFDAEAYLAKRAEEDAEFRELLLGTSKEFFAELTGVCTRQDGIEMLKKHLGACHAGWYHGGPDVECSPKGVTLSGDGFKHRIMRTWTEVYDVLCTIAINGDATQSGSPRAAAPAWETDEPTDDGWYCCWATWEPGSEKWDPDREFLYRRGCAWFENERDADKCVPAQYAVHKWCRIPDDPEEV